MAKTKSKRGHKDEGEMLVCTPVSLPQDQIVKAAKRAIEYNPSNRPPTEQIAAFSQFALAGAEPEPAHLAVLATKYWGTKGVKLGVSFMEQTSSAFRDLVLEHMNGWSEFANVSFAWSQSSGEVRISTGPGGYYSYLGTDILSIPRNRQTMNLQGFTTSTPLSEYKRVVYHETGHTLGFPHEHARRALVERLDPAKVITEFKRTQGWSEQMIRQQILTPIEESSLLSFGTVAEDVSIMAYQFPGRLTKDGRPISGGMDFSDLDKKVAGQLYPLVVNPPPPSAGGKLRYVVEVDPVSRKATIVGA